MRTMKDPRQTELYDPFQHLLSPLARKKLEMGWQAVFRHVILELLPAGEIGEKFHESLGKPTKELYSMAGLVLIQEFMNWSNERAAEAYMLNVGVQYALNLDPAMQELSERTLQRYKKIVREEELAGKVFEEVTSSLVQALNLKLDKQRLDSSHLFSNMAIFGRTQLMGVAIKRFLTQLRRHALPAYEALPQALRMRYAPSDNHLFGDTRKDAESHKRVRQEVAEDMHLLVARFEHNEAHNGRKTYQDLVRVFFEQCEVAMDKVKVKEKEKEKGGGRVMQNPSDPDATYDGRKGSGYQVQLSETCSVENEVQLITAVLPQTAADTDAESYGEVQQALAASNRLPAQSLADTAYGSDKNVETAKQAGVELVSPVNTSKRDNWKLRDSYGMANVFSEEPMELVRCDTPTGNMADFQFLWPELGDIDGSLPREERLARLAELVTMPENGPFSRTIVNRLWARMLGRGLIEPLDNIEGESWHPELMDWLARDFIEHGYDLKHAMRLIMTSQAYQWPAYPYAPEADSAYVFQGPAVRKLSAEQFADAVSAVTGVWQEEPQFQFPGESEYDSPVRAWRVPADPLMRALGRPNREQVTTRREDVSTTLQALELTNGETLATMIQWGAENILEDAPESAQALVERLYLHAVQRPPTPQELALAQELLAPEIDQEGLEDFLWALAMLPEFQFIY